MFPRTVHSIPRPVLPFYLQLTQFLYGPVLMECPCVHECEARGSTLSVTHQDLHIVFVETQSLIGLG